MNRLHHVLRGGLSAAGERFPANRLMRIAILVIAMPSLAVGCVGDSSARDDVQSNAVGQAETDGLTVAQRNAMRSANDYLKISGFSRQGLINQLSSDFGDRYSVEDATVAVDRLNVDWNAQAARSAQQYLSLSGFSCQGLITQLSSSYGENYTVDQATAGAKSAGAC